MLQPLWLKIKKKSKCKESCEVEILTLVACLLLHFLYQIEAKQVRIRQDLFKREILFFKIFRHFNVNYTFCSTTDLLPRHKAK